MQKLFTPKFTYFRDQKPLSIGDIIEDYIYMHTYEEKDQIHQANKKIDYLIEVVKELYKLLPDKDIITIADKFGYKEAEDA